MMILRNAASGGSLFAGADGMAQGLEQPNNNRDYKWDRWRTLGAALQGCFYTGIVYPIAYRVLEARFPGRSWRAVLVKSGVEILTVGIFVNSTSMFGRALWQGTHELATIQQHVLDETPRVTATDAQVWGPYNLIAFSYIPIHIRPLTTSAMEAGWQTYISLRSHDYAQQQQGEEDEVSNGEQPSLLKEDLPATI